MSGQQFGDLQDFNNHVTAWERPGVGRWPMQTCTCTVLPVTTVCGVLLDTTVAKLDWTELNMMIVLPLFAIHRLRLLKL
jgi:hypothetical protein